MKTDSGLEAALARVGAIAAGVGRRTSRWAIAILAAAAVAWASLVGRWAFESPGAFVAWLPLLGTMLVPGLVLRGFGTRVSRLGPAVGDIARRANLTVGAVSADANAAMGRGRGVRSLIKALREVGAHGSKIRSLIADTIGTARVVTLPYLALVGLALAGAGVVLTLLLVGLATLTL